MLAAALSMATRFVPMPAAPTATPTNPAPISADLRSAIDNPLRKFAFWLAVALVFVRFSMIHQVLTYYLHVNLRLLYVIGIPALVALFASGGIQRAFRFRPAIYWTFFAFWLLAVSPFSSWRGGSATVVFSYLRSEVMVLFIIGGLALTWRETKLMVSAIALAAVLNVLSSKLFSVQDINDRVGLEFGTISNPNDYAAQLILVLPFLLWAAIAAKGVLIRLAAFATMSYGVYVALSSASRGAALAIVAEVIALIVVANTRQRIFTLVIGPVLLMIAAIALPSRVFTRILSFSENSAVTSGEAIESSRIRTTLFKDSLAAALAQPIWGIGPGQFSTYEGRKTEAEGRGKLWFNPHNSYLQAASEAGLPAFFAYLAGIISTILLFHKVHKQVRGVPGYEDMDSALVCMKVAMAGYCLVTFFLNFTYFFYLPAMAGLATSFGFALLTRGVPLKTERPKAPWMMPAPPQAKPVQPAGQRYRDRR